MKKLILLLGMIGVLVGCYPEPSYRVVQMEDGYYQIQKRGFASFAWRPYNSYVFTFSNEEDACKTCAVLNEKLRKYNESIAVDKVIDCDGG